MKPNLDRQIKAQQKRMAKRAEEQRLDPDMMDMSVIFEKLKPHDDLNDELIREILTPDEVTKMNNWLKKRGVM